MCPSNRKGGGLPDSLLTAEATMHLDDPHALLQAFQTLDRDGDGAIDCHDLSIFFQGCLRQQISPEEAAAMIAEADLNGDGVVGLQEFQRLMAAENGALVLMRQQQEEVQKAALRQVFEVLDVNKDGRLGREDLKASMAMSGQPFSEQDVDAMVSDAARLQQTGTPADEDDDDDGGVHVPAVIDFDCFYKLMLAF